MRRWVILMLGGHLAGCGFVGGVDVPDEDNSARLGLGGSSESAVHAGGTIDDGTGSGDGDDSGGENSSGGGDGSGGDGTGGETTSGGTNGSGGDGSGGVPSGGTNSGGTNGTGGDGTGGVPSGGTSSGGSDGSGGKGTGGISGSGGSGGSTACPDFDGDGYCQAEDCNDKIPTCHTDCTTASDDDAFVDCIEEFCGSDPSSSSSACIFIDDEASLDAALRDSESTSGPDFIVIGSVTVTSPLSEVKGSDGVTLKQLPGGTIFVDMEGSGTVFKISGTNSVFEDLDFESISSADTIIEVTGDDNHLSGLHIDGFDRRGIFINGADRVELLDNFVTGGLDAPSGDTGAFVLKNAVDLLVSGNIAARNNTAGFQLRNTDKMYFDHNTAAHNTGAGVHFFSDESSQVCMRNNLLSHNSAAGIWLEDDDNTFNQSTSCTAVLPGSPNYGNATFENDGGNCQGNCGELPSGIFFEFAESPSYLSTELTAPGFYCLGEGSGLVDAAHDTGWYDRNGEAPGLYHGAAPDVGARESGPDCDQ